MSQPHESLPPRLVQELLRATGADAVARSNDLQQLWSGYGSILRCELRGAPGGTPPTAIAKHIRWPTRADHPRGWSSNRGHERKVRSYQVERHFYEQFARRCDDRCRVPAFYGSGQHGDDQLLVLEDLDPAGFPVRPSDIDDRALEACLCWLAHFHATFINVEPEGLWPVGTYWHLETRPDELAALEDSALAAAAPELDRRLRHTEVSTLVHGDAKLANFCFAPGGSVGQSAGQSAGQSGNTSVAAVDFQYVGGGCGMKDLAYFVSSCFDEAECERREGAILDSYFAHLTTALERRGKTDVATRIEADWRPLYPVAWTDFYRFLKGWSPGHWKLHRYSERLAREVMASL